MSVELDGGAFKQSVRLLYRRVLDLFQHGCCEGDIQDLRFSDVPYGSSILVVVWYRESIVEVADG